MSPKFTSSYSTQNKPIIKNSITAKVNNKSLDI